MYSVTCDMYCVTALYLGQEEGDMYSMTCDMYCVTCDMYCIWGRKRVTGAGYCNICAYIPTCLGIIWQLIRSGVVVGCPTPG